MVPDVAATWPVFDDDASAKTQLHDANSDWMEFSERTSNHLSGCSSRPVTPEIVHGRRPQSSRNIVDLRRRPATP
jgi:hypothetical protein